MLYQKEVYGVTLNLHFKEREMMDLKVMYCRALIMSNYRHIAHQHHPVHMCFKGLAILIAAHICTKSTDSGNREKHKVKKNLPVNTIISYSLASCGAKIVQSA